MTDPSRYQRADHPDTTRRGLPRVIRVAVLAAAVAAVVVIVVMLASGGHDLSQMNHG